MAPNHNYNYTSATNALPSRLESTAPANIVNNARGGMQQTGAQTATNRVTSASSAQ